MLDIMYRYVCTCSVYYCVIIAFLLSIDCPLSVLFHVFFKANYTRTGDENDDENDDENVSSPKIQHSTDKAIGSAQQEALGTIKSLLASNHGPLFSAPFTFCCIFPCSSVAGGASRLRSGALAQTYIPGT